MKVPKLGTVKCSRCGFVQKSWDKVPLDPCQRCGSYAVQWVDDFTHKSLKSQEELHREWVRDQYEQRDWEALQRDDICSGNDSACSDE